MKFNILNSEFSFNSYVYYLTREFELVTRGFELVTREFELVTRRFELVTRGFELVTRVLLFHFKYVVWRYILTFF